MRWDILKGRELLEKRLIIGIGNGKTTSFWYHRWVRSSLLFKLIEGDVLELKTHWFICDII